MPRLVPNPGAPGGVTNGRLSGRPLLENHEKWRTPSLFGVDVPGQTHSYLRIDVAHPPRHGYRIDPERFHSKLQPSGKTMETGSLQ
jgi:hypothetical protein